MLHTTAQAKGGLRPPLHFVVIPSGETIASPDTGRVGLVRYPVGGQNQHSDWRMRATFVQPVSFLFANHVPSSRGLLACRRAMMGRAAVARPIGSARLVSAPSPGTP